jgi:hypothetical protein
MILGVKKKALFLLKYLLLPDDKETGTNRPTDKPAIKE